MPGAIEQLSLKFEDMVCGSSTEQVVKGTPLKEILPFEEFDLIIISISAGKDSMGCVMNLLDRGVPKEKMVLFHQNVDGSEEDEEVFDWPCTLAYCKAVSEHFGIPLEIQYRSKGILGEMLRENSKTGDVFYTWKGETYHLPTVRGNLGTRLKWPALSPDLRVRWCSSSAKIDVFRRVLNNIPELKGTPMDPKKILVVTGERRAEGGNRSKYHEMEVHPCNSKSRLVQWYRPVIDFKEQQIWELYQKYKIMPHPAYMLGWNRVSCMSCIFSTPSLFRMYQEIAPERFQRLVDIEKQINHTLDSKMTLEEKASLGCLKRLPVDHPQYSRWLSLALGKTFSVADLICDGWITPTGAYLGSEGGSL